MGGFFRVMPIAAILTGCTVLSKRLVDSPSAAGGEAIRFNYSHGGVRDGSPPDAIRLTAKDDTTIWLTVLARPVKRRATWTGILVPMIPVYFLRPVSFYDAPDTLLEMNLWIKADAPASLVKDSVRVEIGGREYAPVSMVEFASEQSGFPLRPKKGNWYYPDADSGKVKSYQLKFPIMGKTVARFKMAVSILDPDLKWIHFPAIEFSRKWQSMVSFGP
ncbi:MAG: hypothetical protein JWO30_4427 [Fibrobacteres bacterium]|nr:hypothetical protein [Fibrobacterota bacterium]